jgi:hypothetical protein
MTPQEKAIELIDKMYLVVLEQSVKQGALIVVDEVLNADWFIPTKEDSTMWSNYWNEVKQEIEKL